MTRTLAIAISLLLLSGSGTAAQTWQQYIRNTLYRDTGTLRDAGYTMSSFVTGTLYDGYAADHDVSLRAGVSYRIVGECDTNCSDLDIKLYDENGNLVSSDLQDDDTPVVSVTPRWSGDFRIHVIMANCITDYCGYGVGLFRY